MLFRTEKCIFAPKNGAVPEASLPLRLTTPAQVGLTEAGGRLKKVAAGECTAPYTLLKAAATSAEDCAAEWDYSALQKLKICFVTSTGLGEMSASQTLSNVTNVLTMFEVKFVTCVNYVKELGND